MLLLLLFLITNSGMAVNVHWCGGKITSVDFYSADKPPCKCGKRAMKPGCCKDIKSVFKAKSDFSNAIASVFKLDISKIVFIPLKQLDPVRATQDYCFSVFYHPPPFKPKAPIYLLDRVFRI